MSSPSPLALPLPDLSRFDAGPAERAAFLAELRRAACDTGFFATVPLLPLSDHLAAEAPGPATDPAKPLFYEVGWNTLKGRLRSHPDVAERHYADLLRARA